MASASWRASPSRSAQEPASSFILPLVPIFLRRIAQYLLAALLPFVNDHSASVPIPIRLSQEEKQERSNELREQRINYQYGPPKNIPGVPFFKGKALEIVQELPSLFWAFKVVPIVVRTSINGQLNRGAIFSVQGLIKTIRSGFGVLFLCWRGEDQLASTLHHALDDSDYQLAAERLEARASAANAEFRKAQLFGSNFEETGEALRPYREMYRLIARQKISDVFLQDSVFARLRTAGFNPISLFRVDDVSDARIFNVDDARMPHQGDTIALAVKEKRLYGLDFSDFSSIKQKENNEPKRLILPSKALFVLPPGADASEPKQLQAVAIEMPVPLGNGQFGLRGRIVYPYNGGEEHGAEWEIAKMIVNVCDSIHHELVAHLARTHLLVEPFIVSSMRQLSFKHPLHKLLRPHFEGTLFINNVLVGKIREAGTGLVGPGGLIDKLFGGDRESVMKWIADRVITNNFNASMPDTEMAARGVDDKILDYPYREDALEHFLALNKWVAEYLLVYYRSDEEMSQDPELQGWVAELVSNESGMVRDFGDAGDGELKTRAYLTRAVSFIIFSCSVQHAAVNFPQNTLMSYAPSVAGAIWKDLPSPDTPATLETWGGMLPPMKESLMQLDILTLLGGVYHTTLGEYGRNDLPRDSAVTKALSEYKKRLHALEAKIERHEKSEILPYDFMRPSRIPQSINI